MTAITFGSLFDGIGGFPLAAQRNGIAPVWASEIEPFPIEVTKYHFPDMLHIGDITKLNGAKLIPVDIITGGSPCQDLSVAGKRVGLKGKRSGLFMEQIRVISEMRAEDERNGRTGNLCRPRYMVWENVPGAFSSCSGEDFHAVIEEICRIADSSLSVPRPPDGAWLSAGCIMGDKFSVAWRVLDAQYWSLAQRRKRIFLVADFGGQTAPKILFESCGLPWHSAQSDCERKRTPTNSAESSGVAGKESGTLIAENEDAAVFENHGIDARYTGPLKKAPTVTARFGTGGNNVPLTLSQPETYAIAGNIIDRKDENGGNGIGVQKDVSYTLTSTDHHCVFSQQRSDIYMQNDVVSTQSARQYKDATDLVCSGDVAGIDCRSGTENGDLCGTLQAHASGGYSLNTLHPVRIGRYVRRLTPLECERLMGFPDGWTALDGATDSARYRALGNSVAIPCVEFILQGIASFLLKFKE
jgi:DNA (cytosine-5)-methyltransferase 1